MTDQIVFPPTTAPSSFTGAMRDFGFEPGNLICSGEGNSIILSRRCTIINGYRLEIQGSYNTHAIGQSPVAGENIVNSGDSNRFNVHCSSGLYCTGDIVGYQRSDLRLKDNILSIKNASNILRNITPISYKWNNFQERYIGNDIGVSAQQVQKYIPMAASDRLDGYKAVKYKKIIPILVQSIKERQIRIHKLKKQIETIKNGR